MPQKEIIIEAIINLVPTVAAFGYLLTIYTFGWALITGLLVKILLLVCDSYIKKFAIWLKKKLKIK